MKILVVGRSGQVASALVDAGDRLGIQLTALGRPALDVCDRESITAALSTVQPDVVINAAAYTAVDQAEADEKAAFELNATAPGLLAEAASEIGAELIHFSTDYVFDGTKDGSYVETDPVAPLGVYGRSKLAGELAVLKTHPSAIVLRTAWVYSHVGKNFVKTMLRLAAQRDELSVVSDQIGNPTSAEDIATAALRVADALLLQGGQPLEQRVLHMSATGSASWAEFAEHVLKASAELGGETAKVHYISSAEYPTPVKRPSNSRLNCEALRQQFNVELPHWRDSARLCVRKLTETTGWKS